MEGRRDQFAAEVAVGRRPRRGARPARSSDRAIDRWVWYAGWADKIAQVLGLVEPGRRAVLQLHDPRADRRRRHRRAGVVLAAGARVAAGAGARRAATSPWSLTSETRPLPADHADRGARHVRRAGRRRQRADRHRAELVPVLAAHVDVDGLDGWGVPTTSGSPPRRPPPTPSSGCRAGRRASRTRGSTGSTTAPTERPEWIAAFLEMKTVWHPIGI